MSRRKSDAGLTALAIGGTLLTLGGFALAVALSKRAITEPSFGPLLPPKPGETPGTDYSEDDLEAAARMLASENSTGSRALWTEQIGSQLHARKPGETLFDRITAGSGFGPQGEKSWPGRVRPVATDQLALPVHRKFAAEVLAGLHPAQFPRAVGFFEPAQQDKVLRIADRAREKLKQGVPLTKQEERLRHYKKSADDIRADWQKTMRLSGTVDGVEFYEMSKIRINPEDHDFAAREAAIRLAWPIARTEIKRVGDQLMDSRPKTGEPHKGVDLFAKPGTPVTAARSGRVKRVVDGRGSDREAARRAGLWVDVAVGKQIDRYLHLGEAKVLPGQKIKRGDLIGAIAEAETSGTGKGPHLHFEVRAGDYTSERQDYGAPINPKFEVV